MLRLLSTVAVFSILTIQTGFAATAIDQPGNLPVTPSIGTGVNSAPQVGNLTKAAPRAKHRRTAAKPTKAAPRGYGNPTAEFTAAAAYENGGHDDLAIPLYRELAGSGSTAPIAKSVKLDGGAGPRLGATVADEAAHRLEVIATKARPVAEGAVPPSKP